MAQQNFSDQLKAFKDQVLSHWEKKSILLLDNAPWKAHQPSEFIEPCSDSLPLAIIQEKEKATEEATKSENAAKCSERLASSEDTPAPSLVMQTLEELKKENSIINGRLDKKEDTSKEIKEMLGKQEESSTQIKSLLEALFT